MKNMNQASRSKQQGIALGVVLVVVALLGAISYAIVASSRTGSTDTSNEVGRVNASVIMAQGTNLKDGFTRMMARGTAANTITMDSAENTGLFHPVDGGAVLQNPPADALVADSEWVYKTNVKINGVGITANDDRVIVLPNLSQGVCAQLNHLLNGDELDATPAASGVAAADWTTAATAVDMSAVAGLEGETEGCVGTTTAGSFAYYQVISAQ